MIRDLTKPLAWDATIPTGKLVPLAMEMLNAVLGDDALMGKAEIAAMGPGEKGMGVTVMLHPIFRPKLETFLQGWLARQR